MSKGKELKNIKFITIGEVLLRLSRQTETNYVWRIQADCSSCTSYIFR